MRYPRMPTIMPLSHHGKSKLFRATNAIIMAEQGRLYLPEQAAWLDDFESECTVFVGDDAIDVFTDQVDVLAYAALHMQRHGLMAHAGLPMVLEGPRVLSSWNSSGQW
jgi:hypothetical protein